MFQIDSTRKHFIPQSYLKGFAIEDKPKLIYQLDKQALDDGVQVRSITDVEVSRHAYSIEHDRLLKSRENVLGRILHELRSQSADELNNYIDNRERSNPFRLWLTCFVIEARMRSRGLREQMRTEETHDLWLALREFVSQQEASFSANYPEEYDKHSEAFSVISDMIGADDERVYEAIMVSPVMRGPEAQKLCEEIADGSWRFDSTIGDRSYITSDIPSTMLVLGPEPQYSECKWFTLPINSKLTLSGQWGEWRQPSGLASRLVEVDDRAIDIANKATYQGAQRFIYGSSEQELLKAAKQ